MIGSTSKDESAKANLSFFQILALDRAHLCAIDTQGQRIPRADGGIFVRGFARLDRRRGAAVEQLVIPGNHVIVVEDVVIAAVVDVELVPAIVRVAADQADVVRVAPQVFRDRVDAHIRVAVIVVSEVQPTYFHH